MEDNVTDFDDYPIEHGQSVLEELAANNHLRRITGAHGQLTAICGDGIAQATLAEAGVLSTKINGAHPLLSNYEYGDYHYQFDSHQLDAMVGGQEMLKTLLQPVPLLPQATFAQPVKAESSGRGA